MPRIPLKMHIPLHSAALFSGTVIFSFDYLSLWPFPVRQDLYLPMATLQTMPRLDIFSFHVSGARISAVIARRAIIPHHKILVISQFNRFLRQTCILDPGT